MLSLVKSMICIMKISLFYDFAGSLRNTKEFPQEKTRDVI